MSDKARYEVRIEKQVGPYDWQPYITMNASSFRLDSENERYGNVPTRYFAVYPVGDLTDFEGDDVALARIVLQLPSVDTSWLPSLEIFAYVSEMAASVEPQKNPNEGGWAFRPPVDEDWEPSLVKIFIKDLPDYEEGSHV